jgi:hypothetical protein
MTRRQRTRRGGGIWDSLTSAWSQTKKDASDAYTYTANAVSPGSAPAPTYTSAPSTYTPVLGGRKRRSRRSKRGGYSANTPMSGLASSAASFSGKTAQPHTWVGGKTRRRRRSHTKSCKRKRSCKH